MRILSSGLLVAASLSLGACAYGGPFGGASIGYGSGYGGYGGYGYGGYPYGGYPYGSYYGSPYYGWYDGFYYPGWGDYVYDRDKNPHVWSDALKKYWTGRRQAALGSAATTSGTAELKPNWSGFKRDRNVQSATVGQSADREAMVRARAEARAEARAQARESTGTTIRSDEGSIRPRRRGGRP